MPQAPHIGVTSAQAGVWSEDLSTPSKSPIVSENQGSTSKAKANRVKKAAEGNSARDKARKKGQDAFLTIVIMNESCLRYQWKDASGTNGSASKVTFLPGWDQETAELRARAAYDSFWGPERARHNRLLAAHTGRLILQASAQAKASGKHLAYSSDFRLQGLLKKHLTREVVQNAYDNMARQMKLYDELMGAS